MRGKQAKKRVLLPDPDFDSVVVTKLINYVMHGGKKSQARQIVSEAIELAAKKSKQKPLDMLNKAIENVSPILEVRSKRIGGATYQIPYEVSKERRLILALRWMVNAARARKGSDMGTRLSQELIDAYQGEGTAVKKKEDTHRMAEANRAFAHFARY